MTLSGPGSLNGARTRPIAGSPHRCYRPGRELLSDLDRRLQAAEQQLLAGLEKETDRGTFRALLCQLASHAGELDAEPGPCDVAQHEARPPARHRLTR